MRLRRTRVHQIPEFGVPSAFDPRMVDVTEDEIISVLAWRIRDLEQRLRLSESHLAIMDAAVQ